MSSAVSEIQTNAGDPTTSKGSRSPAIDDRDAVELWGRVINGFGATSKVLQERAREKFDLSAAEMESLLTLYLLPEHNAPMKTLAEAAAFSTGGFTKIADKLSTRGITRRIACAKDRRVTYLALTEEGQAFAAEVTRFVAETNREIFIGVLGEARARDVARAITELYRANAAQTTAST